MHLYCIIFIAIELQFTIKHVQVICETKCRDKRADWLDMPIHIVET